MKEKSVEKKCLECGEVHARCIGHKKRKNSPDGKLHPCQKYPLKSRSGCRLHGGKTLLGKAHPNFTDGRQSKYQFMPNLLATRVETLVFDAIENLETSIRIQMTLESQMYEKLGTGESSEAWIKLKTAVTDYDNAYHIPDKNKSAQEKAKAFGMIKFIVNTGISETFLIRDIQGIQETQRKLTETVTKCRKEIQETYTSEQWNSFLEIVMRIIRNNVDSRQLNNIQTALLAASQNSNEPQLLG